jgi:hypothetical protein
MYEASAPRDNKMSMAVVFLDIETAYDTTRRSGLFYKLSKLVFWVSLIKLISPFFATKIQSLGRRRNVYAKVYTSRDATRFPPVPHTIQHVQTLTICHKQSV